MSDRFELHFTKNSYNHADALRRIKDSALVVAVTYGLGTSAKNNPLLKELRKMKRGSTAIVITSIPGRTSPTERDPGDPEANDIETLVSLLDPSKFDCALAAWFCFENHAKILRCDDIVYIGSANMTVGTARKYEAGCTFRGSKRIAEVDAFLKRLIDDSTPYLNLQKSEDLLILFKFCSRITRLLAQLEDHACEWEPDPTTGDGEMVFSADAFSIPQPIIDALNHALAAAKRLDDAAIRRSELDEPDPKHASEDKFAEALWTDYLEELLNDAALINEHKVFDKPFNDTSESEDLVEKMIGMEPDVTALMASSAFQNELYDRKERHEEKRKREAERAFHKFREALAGLRGKLRKAFTSLGVSPLIGRAPKNRFAEG